MLVYAKLDSKYNSIVTLTKGIVFLGTPHRGSDLGETASIIAKLTPLASNAVVQDLKNHSHKLSDLSEQFVRLLSSPNLEVASFYETRPTVIPNRAIIIYTRLILKQQLHWFRNQIIVNRDSAILSSHIEVCIPLDTDHTGLSKFDSSGDTLYRKIEGKIKKYVSDSGKILIGINIITNVALRQ